MFTVYPPLTAALEQAGVQAEFVIGGLSEDELRTVQVAARTDQQVIDFTSDPERFLDRTAAQNWLSKRRYICKLLGADGELLGLAWLGQKTIPEYAIGAPALTQPERYSHTLSLRMYGDVRGKHLAGSFVQTALNAYLHSCGEIDPGFWAETSVANTALQRVIGRLGFVQVAQQGQKSKAVYVWPAPESMS